MTTKKGMNGQLFTDFLIEQIIERKIPDDSKTWNPIDWDIRECLRIGGPKKSFCYS